MTPSQHIGSHSIKIKFSEEKTTSFCGLALSERAAKHARLWSSLEQRLPARSGFDWLTIVKSMTGGLLTGARGTFATQDLREDAALVSLLGLRGAPEEATVWRSLKGLGRMQRSGLLAEVQLRWARSVLSRARRKDLLRYGFFPLFADGSLLEGSRKREGTKYLREKGAGLLWATVFAGPVLGAQRLVEEGEGEESCVRAMLPEVVAGVLGPLKLKEEALALVDSLHGDGPTLAEFERLGLHYVAGANKLKATAQTLSERPEAFWFDLGPDASRGFSRQSVCVCWLQCRDWEKKRTLVGRRWMREGEMIWNYSGVVTDLEESDVAHVMKARQTSYAEAIWHLYDLKMGMETYYQDLLSDLGLHHPPCRELIRNAGFYAVASLAHTLAAAVNLLGRPSLEEHSTQGKKKRPGRMRLWRRFFALPGRVAYHQRVLEVTLLGLGETVRREFERIFWNISRC